MKTFTFTWKTIVDPDATITLGCYVNNRLVGRIQKVDPVDYWYIYTPNRYIASDNFIGKMADESEAMIALETHYTRKRNKIRGVKRTSW